MQEDEGISAFCRDCFNEFQQHAARSHSRCPKCASPRIIAHHELRTLSLAHIDCDAFLCNNRKTRQPFSVEPPSHYRRRKRGVVAAACYVARLYGVKSAMPMFKALSACPAAVVISPNMAKYQAVGREIRAMMRDLTPLVQPVSIDEAFLDLSGTENVHGSIAACSLANLVQRMEQNLGITASVGLSYNKFLAKIASDLDKPRGFAILGQSEAIDFLAQKPVGLLWGVGKALESKLRRDGISQISQLQNLEERDLVARYGSIGTRLYGFARGEDNRKVIPDSETKSISSETTFSENITELDALKERLQFLCKKIAERLTLKKYAAGSIILKLKQANFRLLTRSRQLQTPTQRADILYDTALPLLEATAQGTAFRLIGISAADLEDADKADPPDLFQQAEQDKHRINKALKAVRDKHGDAAIRKGR